jgi:large conductance mechanosensitive channel
MKSVVKEFKEFIMRGNVIDLAVGVIIGGAFQAIVNSLVDDIINPLLSIFLKDIDFSNLTLNVLNAKIGYGSLINAIITFLINGFVIFLIIKAINKASSLTKPNVEEAPAEPTTKVCPYCHSEIHIDATRCPHCTSELDK